MCSVAGRRLAGMVGGMLIVVATAEPRGAYHLSPLAGAISRCGADVVHLVPYGEPLQGPQVVKETTDPDVLKHCDRVVVTGGAFSAWTHLVAQRAAQLGKPLVFSNLAYLPVSPPAASAPPVQAATALSVSDAAVVAQYLNLAAVSVTGTPALDDLPLWRPVNRCALLLSTSDMELRDPSRALLAVASALKQRGWCIRVRPHPREDTGPWKGFELVSGETQAESAATAEVVLGYPGSAHVLAAAVGAPTISLAPTAQLRSVFSAAQAAAISAHTVDVADTLEQVELVQPVARQLVEYAVGPIGGAADRMLATWTRSTSL